jgi:hypothetical protein
MNPIVIEFAPKTAILVLLKSGYAFLSLSFVTLCALVGLGVYVATLNTANEALLEENSKLQQQTSALQINKKKTDKNSKNTTNQAALVSVSNQLNLPWGELLQAFDSSSSKQVALLEFIPDTKTHIIKIVAEARNSAQMTNYIGTLKRINVIDDIKLMHHEVNSNDPLMPIRFELEAYWVGAFPK